MKRCIPVLLLIVCLLPVCTMAQYSRYVVVLKDKNASAFSLSNPSAFLSAKAIARRSRYHIAIDSTDLPVKAAYLDSIRNVPNVTILNVSKWLNQVAIKTTDGAALAKINGFSFVKSTAAIAVRRAQPPAGQPAKWKKYNDFITLAPLRTGDIMGITGITGVQNFYNYGANNAQVHLHEGEYLHNLGFHGEGITIAMLDAGFLSYKTSPAFDSLRQQNQVLGERDYVDNDGSVNEDHYHGSICLSTMAANEPGIMVGTAPKAKFWLLRTEDASSEYPVEEQNWVAAAEFADSAGADMISSSLGYSAFDDPSFSLGYAQRDGKTSMISIGANMAARKGLLITVSAGNDGNNASDAKYVLCPADADSVLTVGATDFSGTIAGFSCWGPNSAGKLKPNVVSVGQGTVVANVYNGTPGTANGTSLSNPNLCGLIACLWQAFPGFSNMEIYNAVQRSGNKFMTPDNRYGYGIPNMRIAYEDLSRQKAVRDFQQLLGAQWIKAFPVPFTNTLNILLKAPATGHSQLRLLDMSGKLIETKVLETQQGSLYTISFAHVTHLSAGVYTVQYIDDSNKTSLRIVKQ